LTFSRSPQLYLAFFVSLLLHAVGTFWYQTVRPSSTPDRSIQSIRVNWAVSQEISDTSGPFIAPKLAAGHPTENTISTAKDVFIAPQKTTRLTAATPSPKASAHRTPTQHHSRPAAKKSVVQRPTLKSDKPSVVMQQQAISVQPVKPVVRVPHVDQAHLLSLYKVQLMRHISTFKHYPKMARRRGIEGESLIRFELLPDGKIKNLQVQSHHLLRKSSERAVLSALPLPRPTPLLEMPVQIALTMEYRLQ